MIHEAEDSASISADKTASIWDIKCRTAEHKQAEKEMIKQQNLINCYSREISIADTNLIL